jgi:hypothetical protein
MEKKRRKKVINNNNNKPRDRNKRNVKTSMTFLTDFK